MTCDGHCAKKLSKVDRGAGIPMNGLCESGLSIAPLESRRRRVSFTFIAVPVA